MHYPDKLIPSSKKGRDWTRKGVDLGSELTQLQIGQAQQIAGMIEALGGALPSELIVLTQKCRQLERLQVMSEQKLGPIGHDAAPVSRPRGRLHLCVHQTRDSAEIDGAIRRTST